MPLPLSHDKTITPGDPIDAQLLNKIQDCIVNGSHGLRTEAHPLDRRLQVNPGVGWAVDGTSASPGSISESTNGRTCHLVFKPPPVGSVITGAGMKVKDGGGTSLVRMELYAKSASESGASFFGSVETAGNGAITTLDVVPGLGMPYTVVKGERLYAALITSGGGAAERRVYELYLTYFRP